MTARFAPGDAVTVLDLGLSGHVRTPFYVRHRCGRIVGLCGHFLNPEALSVGDCSGPLLPVWRVAFRMADLWPHFDGGPDDTLFLEIYDHWLAPAPVTTEPAHG